MDMDGQRVGCAEKFAYFVSLMSFRLCYGFNETHTLHNNNNSVYSEMNENQQYK